jgi:hypothetical protein
MSMAEQILNVLWLMIATFAFTVELPRIDRRRRVVAALALAGIVALLFPIISISDDLSADAAAQEVLAVLFTVVGLIVVFLSATRLVMIAPARLAFATYESSDPRSPPRG